MGSASPKKDEADMAYSNKVSITTSTSSQRRIAAERRPERGTGLVGAPECGDVMKLQVKATPTRASPTMLNIARVGHRQLEPGHRVAKGKTVDRRWRSRTLTSSSSYRRR